MRKKDELGVASSCMGSAHPEEMVFVLLGRDPAAPAAIRAWVEERLRIGKNRPGDAQIREALACADTMWSEGRKWVGSQTANEVPNDPANDPRFVGGHVEPPLTVDGLIRRLQQVRARCGGNAPVHVTGVGDHDDGASDVHIDAFVCHVEVTYDDDRRCPAAELHLFDVELEVSS